MIRACVLAVDIQNDFNKDGSLPVPGASEVPNQVNKLVKALSMRLPGPYLRKIATKDWHEPGHVGEKIWPVHCIQDSYGAEFIEHFDSKEFFVVYKGTVKTVESYSGFASEGAPIDASPGRCAAQEVTNLRLMLDSSAVTHVIVCGLALDVCVKFTAMDALARGFKVCVVLSATRALTKESHDNTVKYFKQSGITVVDTIEECLMYINREAGL